MKFFTPELYLRFNSPDDGEADLADEAWEESIRSYRSHLDSFRDGMPPRVLELAERICLHDAELLALRADRFDSLPEPTTPSPAATISLKREGEMINIDYLLWGEVTELRFPGAWPHSTARVHWLFDEVDLDDQVLDPAGQVAGRYWHRILLSDGRSLAIPFSDAITSRFDPGKPEPALVERAGA